MGLSGFFTKQYLSIVVCLSHIFSTLEEINYRYQELV